MPRTAYWNGHLRLSLVSAAVSLSPAVSDSGRIRFHVVNRKTGNRVESRYVDSVTHKPIADTNQVKGFAQEDGSFVLLEDDEIDAVALESTKTIDISTFVPKDSIDLLWYDRPHFLLPKDKISTEAFSVIRAAMQRSGVVGIARLVLYRREHAVLLEPSGKGIVLWTLRYSEDVREPVSEFKGKSKLDSKILKTLEKRIAAATTSWKPVRAKDPVQQKIATLLKSKEKQPNPKSKKAKAGPKSSGNVINIMDALKKSLESEKR